MKCDINPAIWDVSTGKVSGRTSQATEINNLIESTKAALHKVYHELQGQGHDVTAQTVRNHFLGVNIEQHTLLTLFDQHNSERERLIDKTISKSTHLLIELTVAWYSIHRHRTDRDR